LTERSPIAGGTPSADLLGAVLIIVASLAFGGVVVLGKIVEHSGGLSVPSLLAIRFLIAGLLLASVVLGTGRSLRAAPGEGWRLAALGVGCYAVEAGFFFAGLGHGTVAAVTLLFFTYPAIVAVMAFALGKGLPGWLLGGALASTAAGTALVVVGSGGIDIDGAGVAFALGSAVTFSLYLTGADAVLNATNSLVGSIWVSVSAGVGLALFAVVTGRAELPHGSHQWVPVTGMALFTAAAFVALFAGLRRLGAVRTSILSATEPLTAAVLAAIFLDESIRGFTVLGGLFILAGAVAASLARRVPGGEPQIP
jgi:drug/metabolite transporter (DMT)-like permease